MPKYRVTVDYGDDRVRTYKVEAESVDAAEQHVVRLARELLTVAASDDVDEWHPDDYDAFLRA